MSTFSLPIPPELLEQIAERAAEILAARAAPAVSPWMSADQAADYTGIPKQSLYKLTAAKAIPHAKPGNRLLFKREDLDAWLDAHREGPAAGRHLRALSNGGLG